MNALTPTENKQLTLDDCRISTPLWRLLSSNQSADMEIDEILSNPVLHQEAKLISPMLKALAQGCGPKSVQHALQPLVLVYGIGEAARSAAFWEVYRKTLEDVPAESLRQAIEDYAGWRSDFITWYISM